jgi:multidrug efflux system membrane fusion protein
MPVVPVTAATAVSKDVPIQLRPIGNVESLASIPVKAQIAGELVAIHFKEGQDVQKGALLFEIDRSPYEQALRQAEANFNRDVAQERQAQANLARDVAQAKNAGAQADRYAQLAAQGVVSKEQNDQMRTSSQAMDESTHADQAALESARAAAAADKAAVETAKLNLECCRITALYRWAYREPASKDRDPHQGPGRYGDGYHQSIFPAYVTFFGSGR